MEQALRALVSAWDTQTGNRHASAIHLNLNFLFDFEKLQRLYTKVPFLRTVEQ
jgi:hypothetical protein